MSKEWILIISEGEKTEKHIVDNLKKNFFNNAERKKEIEFLPFRTNIYALWNVLKEDNFETNIIEVLIERDPGIEERMKEINKKAISEIYLFFDYDGHAYNKVDEVDDIITEMIDFFDNETESGKIYISYPMVEAIKHLKRNDDCFKDCCVPAKENIHYKNIVGKYTEYRNLTTLNVQDWYCILGQHLRKANHILSASFEIPDYDGYKETFNQVQLFEHQLSRFIAVDQTVAVLSGFPFFLIDYFGENIYAEVI